MNERAPHHLPPINALVAFECVARHGSFTLAARELETSQSAVSRHIATLETWLAARLFERSRAGATLTEAGRRFRVGVASGLAAIRRSAAETTEMGSAEQVVIACSHETSHFLIMPRYAELRRALGEDVGIRVLTYHYHAQSLPADLAADIRLTWEPGDTAPEDRVVAMKEEVRPVCAPAYAATHADVLAGPAAGWGPLTLLDLVRPNEGWATWEDWFAAAGQPERPPRRLGIDSYAYVLEAAVGGHGIALGWRHFIERYLDAGTLIALGEGFVRFERTHYGVLTEHGRHKPLARKCLEFFRLAGT